MLSIEQTSVSQPFLVRGTLTKLCRYFAGLLDGPIGLKIKELYWLVAPRLGITEAEQWKWENKEWESKILI